MPNERVRHVFLLDIASDGFSIQIGYKRNEKAPFLFWQTMLPLFFQIVTPAPGRSEDDSHALALHLLNKTSYGRTQPDGSISVCHIHFPLRYFSWKLLSPALQ